MKEIFINKDNLLQTDITEEVIRVKVLFLNKDNQLLLGYSHHIYQFPGGHLENNETLIDCLKREIKEETGISLKITDVKPFMILRQYSKDWPEKGKNRENKIYYFSIYSDECINLDEICYTENELEGNFELRYIGLDNIEEVLKENAVIYPTSAGIAKEMLSILEEYKNSL